MTDFLEYSDQPTTCPDCGARTDPIGEDVERCLDCGKEIHMIEPDDD